MKRLLAAGAATLAMLAPALLPGTSAAAGVPTVPTPHAFNWISSPKPVITPQQAAGRDLVSAKDPSVVWYDGAWHVFMTMYDAKTGWTMAYKSFRNWSQADSAPQYLLDQSAIGPGYRAAPQIFYFAPQKLWYLVFQTDGGGSYSTTTTIADPSSWSAPKNFYSKMPQIIRDNIGQGYWLDFWTICDDAKCYLFSSDDNGQLYRSETRLQDFPSGFDNSTVIAMAEPNRFDLFEGSGVYRLGDSGSYLLLVEAIGSDGRRWFRSWTSTAIAGPWTPLADTEATPFARSNNVHFPGGAWTRDISHGEMIRADHDQRLTIDPCSRNKFLYQGLDPNAGGDYNLLPYRLGLLSQQGPDPLDAYCVR